MIAGSGVVAFSAAGIPYKGGARCPLYATPRGARRQWLPFNSWLYSADCDVILGTFKLCFPHSFAPSDCGKPGRQSLIMASPSPFRTGQAARLVPPAAPFLPSLFASFAGSGRGRTPSANESQRPHSLPHRDFTGPHARNHGRGICRSPRGRRSGSRIRSQPPGKK